MDYEKLGAFYIGREVVGEELQQGAKPLLYDSSDLTTHAVIVGMTGSGKTGLGIDLIEEAALDGIPVLAIDPKGDLANLALTFPSLRPADFEPWIDAREAEKAGVDLSVYAEQVAQQWREGLGSWDQDGDRIGRLRDAANVAVYTPGYSAGRPLSVLRSFAAPPAGLLDDPDLLAERLSATTAGLLTLLGADADPLGREHILLASILDYHWRESRDLALAELIAAVQNPPFKQIGVMSLETVFPAKDRMKLALSLNTLLAAPGFQAWLAGEALDIQSLLYEADGKPRVAVIAISHLSESERAFFLTLLLTEVVAWTRSQSGSTSLRALIYIDELFGMLPPVAEPPTKKPLLTLLKQARAFGVGLALSTQNPVDLDYKALSNAGTWFIGRLQTERDVDRLLAGLTSSDGGTDEAELAAKIARLPKRTFVLHNVHESRPLVFQTRWAMSYLAGPLSRDQIRRLSRVPSDVTEPEEASAPLARAESLRGPAAAPVGTGRPILPPEVEEVFLGSGELNAAEDQRFRATYFPFILAIADVHYSSKTHEVEYSKHLARLVQPSYSEAPPDFAAGEASSLTLERLARRPTPGISFAGSATGSFDERAVRTWQAEFARWLRTEGALMLWRSQQFKLTSRPEESEAEFRLRCSQAAREARDEQKRALRERYESKLGIIERRILREEQAVGRERQQLQHRAVDAVGSLVGALFGSGRRSSALSSAIRKASSGSKDLGDVQRAQERLAQAEAEFADLEAEFNQRLRALVALEVHPKQLDLTTVAIKPSSRDVAVRFLGIAWIEQREVDGRWWPSTDSKQRVSP